MNKNPANHNTHISPLLNASICAEPGRGPANTLTAPHGGIATAKIIYKETYEMIDSERKARIEWMVRHNRGGHPDGCTVDDEWIMMMSEDATKEELSKIEDEQMKNGLETGELTIRKITPKEAWRLMDLCHIQDDGSHKGPYQFDDTPYEKAHAVCSESQLYKQAGNSICVGVLEAIFEQMLLGEQVPETRQVKLCRVWNQIITPLKLTTKGTWKMHNEVHAPRGISPCMAGLAGGNTKPLIITGR